MDGKWAAEWVDKEIAKRGIKVSKFCADTKISRSTLSQWRTGKFQPSRVALAKIKSYWGIDLNEVYEQGNASQTIEEKQAELNAYLDELKNDPEQKILFELAQGATKEQLQATVTFLRMLRGEADK